MSWLKKFGQIALQVTGIMTVFQPLVSETSAAAGQGLSRAMNFAEKMLSIVQQAEIFGQAMGLPGAKKLEAATPAAIQIVLSDLVAGKKVRNPELLRAGSAEIASGFAKVFSAIDEDSLDKTVEKIQT